MTGPTLIVCVAAPERSDLEAARIGRENRGSRRTVEAILPERFFLSWGGNQPVDIRGNTEPSWDAFWR